MKIRFSLGFIPKYSRLITFANYRIIGFFYILEVICYFLGINILNGMTMSWISQKIKLLPIVGVLIIEIILVPYVLSLLDKKILDISADLRQIAYTIILIKMGLDLNLNFLKE